MAGAMLFASGCRKDTGIPKSENIQYTLCEGKPSIEILAEKKWYYTGNGDVVEMILKENGEFSSNYLFDRDWCMGNFSRYTYDENRGLITLSKENDATTTELNILYYTEDSIFVKNEAGDIEQFVSENVLSNIPTLEYVYSDQITNGIGSWDAVVTILQKEGNNIYAGSADYVSNEESKVIEFDLDGNEKYNLLQIQKVEQSEDVMEGFKFVELTKKGVDELLEKGPCKAYITLSGIYEIEKVVFYSEVEMEGELEYSEFFDKKKTKSKKQDIIGTTWYGYGENSELRFTKDGEFSYTGDGDYVGESEMYNSYKHSWLSGTITVYDESKDHSSKITIVEHTADKLILKMEEDLNGGVHTFVSAENQVHKPRIVMNENDYQPMDNPIDVVDIKDNSITTKSVVTDIDGNSSEVSTVLELDDNTVYYIMEDAGEEVNKKVWNKYRYIRLTNTGAQKLVEESSCYAYIDVTGVDNSRVDKVVFYPAWKN